MKALGYVFTAVLLVGAGVVLVKAGLWEQFTTWISSLFTA